MGTENRDATPAPTEAELTRTCQEDSLTSKVVTALEHAWAAIREFHSEVPNAVVVVASGTSTRLPRWGHSAMRWQRGDNRLPEVLVSGEGLKRPAVEVFTTVLHEATHALADIREIQDTSRQGRWHNRRFASLADELGMDTTKDPRIGWSLCQHRARDVPAPRARKHRTAQQQQQPDQLHLRLSSSHPRSSDRAQARPDHLRRVRQRIRAQPVTNRLERSMFTTTTMFQGNLAADPRLRYTTGGTPVAEFRALVSHRVKDGDQWIDGEPTGHNVKVYGWLAEAAADQLRQGSPVLVVGRTETDAWADTETGEKRTTTRVIVDRHGTLGLALTRKHDAT
jgi:single stranded DNA-binding protein